MKVLFAAAVIASLVFFCWRAANKGAYTEHETAQCEAFAVSAAAAAAEALSCDPELAALVRESGKAEFVADHKKMPDNCLISAVITSRGDDFVIETTAASGWNSRSPQKADFSLTLTPNGIVYGDAESEERAARAAELIDSPEMTGSGAENGFVQKIGDFLRSILPVKETEKRNEHIFTFPHERPCAAPFKVRSERRKYKGDEGVYGLVF